MKTLPNAWTFGVYFQGELYSSVRMSVLTSEWRMSPSVERSAISCIPDSIGARSSSIPRVSSPTPKRRKQFPELPYLTCGWPTWPANISTPTLGLAIVRPEHQAFYRRVFLHETMCRAPHCFPASQAGRADGCAFADDAGQGSGPLSVYAFERFRAADAVRPRRRAPCVGRSRSLPPSSLPRSSRVPEPGGRRAESARPARVGFARPGNPARLMMPCGPAYLPRCP